jgi:hypothetical protein
LYFKKTTIGLTINELSVQRFLFIASQLHLQPTPFTKFNCTWGHLVVFLVKIKTQQSSFPDVPVRDTVHHQFAGAEKNPEAVPAQKMVYNNISI